MDTPTIEFIHALERDLAEACEVIVGLRWAAEGQAPASLMTASDAKLDKLRSHQEAFRRVVSN